MTTTYKAVVTLLIIYCIERHGGDAASDAAADAAAECDPVSDSLCEPDTEKLVNFALPKYKPMQCSAIHTKLKHMREEPPLWALYIVLGTLTVISFVGAYIWYRESTRELNYMMEWDKKHVKEILMSNVDFAGNPRKHSLQPDDSPCVGRATSVDTMSYLPSLGKTSPLSSGETTPLTENKPAVVKFSVVALLPGAVSLKKLQWREESPSYKDKPPMPGGNKHNIDSRRGSLTRFKSDVSMYNLANPSMMSVRSKTDVGFDHTVIINKMEEEKALKEKKKKKKKRDKENFMELLELDDTDELFDMVSVPSKIKKKKKKKKKEKKKE